MSLQMCPRGTQQMQPPYRTFAGHLWADLGVNGAVSTKKSLSLCHHSLTSNTPQSHRCRGCRDLRLQYKSSKALFIFQVRRFPLGCRIVFGFLLPQVLVFFAFFPSTICLVFAAVLNESLSFCMVFATFWHGHFAFCMVFATFCHVRLPFCIVFVTFWHFNLSFATFWCFKRSYGSLECSLGFHLGFHLRFHLGFHLGFI